MTSKLQPCQCVMAGFCERHSKIKDEKEFLLCRKDLQYRIHMDQHQNKRSVLWPKHVLELVEKHKHIDTDKINKKIQIAVLGHSETQFSNIKQKDYLKFIMLDQLDLGKYNHLQKNSLAEARAFFCDNLFDENIEYVGTVTASWNSKYSGINKIDEFHTWQSAGALIDSSRKDIILCANKKPRTEAYLLISGLKFIHKKEIVAFVNRILPDVNINNESLLSNQIITHISVYREFCSFIRSIIDEIIKLDLRSELDGVNVRPIAYLIEIISILWFSNKNFLIINNEILHDEWYKKV